MVRGELISQWCGLNHMEQPVFDSFSPTKQQFYIAQAKLASKYLE